MPDQPLVKLCAIGDIMVMQRDRVPRLDPLLRTLFADADIIVGCCEATVARTNAKADAEYTVVGKKSFIYNMPEEFLRGVIAESSAAPEKWYLALANNHAGDDGPDSAYATVRHMRNIGVHPIGYRGADAEPITQATAKGLQIGIASWTHWLNQDVLRPQAQVWKTADIASLSLAGRKRDLGLDCLVGAAHWEYEWQHFPRRATRQSAADLARDGFDVILGSHPHVLQPFEWHGDTLCAYSLGNFCSGFGKSYAARMAPVLVVELGTRGPHRGKVVGYELHLFAQVDAGDDVAIVPMDRAPLPLRAKLTRRAERVMAPEAASTTAGAGPGPGSMTATASTG
ncbi:MAG: CapA family protein [Proteobacteria bacterium]|nr:CapA family protein [Pseudomonadota bacterium]